METPLGLRLVKARSAMGWSQQNLAEVSGVAAAQISRYEAGRSAPRAEVIAKLAQALNVRFEWLAHGTGTPETDDVVPQYPAGFSVEKIEMSSDQLAQISAFAEAEGLTIEMALRQLALEGLARRVANRSESELSDIRRRLEKLEGSK